MAMAERMTAESRSKIMSAVKSRNTGPEMIVRRLLHSLGFRYHLHAKVIKGRLRPDIVFSGKKKVVYVHGCFWHVHKGCKGSHIPGSVFWQDKLARNSARDEATLQSLQEAGWEVLVIWECQLADRGWLRDELTSFLNKAKGQL
jgi:DNA mismatch endonuclease (patch repair protein)